MNATRDVVAAAKGLRSGGCLCGWIRFTVTGEAVYPHVCFPDD